MAKGGQMNVIALDTETAAPPSPDDRAYLLSVDQYWRMADAGIIGTRDQVVLLEGRLVRKLTKNPPHILAHKRTFEALRCLLTGGWHLGGDDPVEMIASVPEPDIIVIRGVAEAYRVRRVEPSDVGLVVEVSDSSLRADQTYLKRIYAKAAIPVYWIVNIPDHRLEVHDNPTGPAEAPNYRGVRHFGAEEDVPLVLDGREIGRVAVKDLLP